MPLALQLDGCRGVRAECAGCGERAYSGWRECVVEMAALPG